MKTWNLFLSVCWLSLFILATWCQYASWNQKLSYCNETEVYFSNYDHYPDLTTQGKNGLKGVRKSPLLLPYQRRNYPSYYRTPFWNCYMAKCHKTHVLGKNCAPWKTMMNVIHNKCGDEGKHWQYWGGGRGLGDKASYFSWAWVSRMA